MKTILYDQETPPVFEGIYDVPEAARYLRASMHGHTIYPVSSSMLIRWIRHGLASHDLIEFSGAELLIAFEDLISMRVIAALRSAGVSWRAINRAEHWLREATEAPRPFATEALWAGQGQVFTEWTKKLLSASRHGQMAFGMLHEYLIPIHGLTFSDSSQAAISWEPIDGIVLEPQIQFGAPCLKGTRIPTRTIAGMIDAGDPAEWVVTAYGLSHDGVKAACDWESRLRSE